MVRSFTSRFIPSGAEPRERRYLAACIALLTMQAGVFVELERASVRFDDVFFAKRERFVLHRQLARPLPMNQVVAVAEHGQGTPLIALLRGWSEVEPWGIWTDGSHAEMAIVLPHEHPSVLALQLWANIMLSTNGTQEIRVAINGRGIDIWNFAQSQAVLCASIPPDIVPGSGLLHVAFDIGSPRPPPDSSDDRLLGFGMKQLEITSSRTKCEPLKLPQQIR